MIFDNHGFWHRVLFIFLIKGMIVIWTILLGVFCRFLSSVLAIFLSHIRSPRADFCDLRRGFVIFFFHFLCVEVECCFPFLCVEVECLFSFSLRRGFVLILRRGVYHVCFAFVFPFFSFEFSFEFSTPGTS